jgi:hypothetical protein
VAAWDALQDPAYRPARPPTLRRLRQRGDAEGLTGRDALAASPGFLILLDVRRPDDGPRVDLARWGSCGITSARRSPATRCVGGNIFSNYRPSMPGLSPRHRVVALIGASARRGAATRPAHRASEHKAVGAAGHEPAPLRSWPTRPTPAGRSALTCDDAGSEPPSRNRPTSGPTGWPAAATAGGHHSSAPRTTSNATSSNAPSTSSRATAR